MNILFHFSPESSISDLYVQITVILPCSTTERYFPWHWNLAQGCFICRVQKSLVFLKKAQPNGFLGFYWVLDLLGISDFLYEWAVGKTIGWLSSSAKTLFRFTCTLDYPKICKFITCWSLEAVNIIIAGVTNWNWIKFGVDFQQVLPKKLAGFLGITRVSEPFLYVANHTRLWIWFKTKNKITERCCRWWWYPGTLYLWLGSYSVVRLITPVVTVGRGSHSSVTVSAWDSLPHRRIRLVTFWVTVFYFFSVWIFVNQLGFVVATFNAHFKFTLPVFV